MTDQRARVRELLEAAGFAPADAAQLAADHDPAALLDGLDDFSPLEDAEQQQKVSNRPSPQELN
ncbi:hypothetical protein ACINK0_18925 (plasmid) [Deinococcus sp. VB343]|uniref:hypothetical protein n=1 Tax=Deinococcus sp. VB343 TaxID=3385567 RepID=UPI0039C9E6FC